MRSLGAASQRKHGRENSSQQLVLSIARLSAKAKCQMRIQKTHKCACGDSLSLRRYWQRLADWILSFSRQYVCSRPAARRTVC